jgi:hypothetical protein
MPNGGIATCLTETGKKGLTGEEYLQFLNKETAKQSGLTFLSL